MAIRTTLSLLALALATPVSAEPFYRSAPYDAPAYGQAYVGPDGFAGEFVRGSYIGAPLTRVPRPSEIVPAPWSYGTYGIPTVTGIEAPPAARPSLTVINAGSARGRQGARAVAPGETAGARVIAVQVPRR
jgi:hypothetical protein